MHPAHQRGGAADRSRPAALGFRRQMVTGSRATTCRPRTQAKQGGNPGWRPPARSGLGTASGILHEPPGPPDGTSGGAKSSVMCSPRRRSANVRSSPSGRTPGHNTDSLVIARLHASTRQITLARALHDYGRLVRTTCICRSVAGEELRRRYVRLALGHCLAGNALESPARQLTPDSHPGRARITGRSAARRPPASRTVTEHKIGVVPMSGQRRLIRRRDCSDLSADWCAWQGYRLAAGRNNQRLSRKASSGSGGW